MNVPGHFLSGSVLCGTLLGTRAPGRCSPGWPCSRGTGPLGFCRGCRCRSASELSSCVSGGGCSSPPPLQRNGVRPQRDHPPELPFPSPARCGDSTHGHRALFGFSARVCLAVAPAGVGALRRGASPSGRAPGTGSRAHGEGKGSVRLQDTGAGAGAGARARLPAVCAHACVLSREPPSPRRLRASGVKGPPSRMHSTSLGRQAGEDPGSPEGRGG